MRKFRKKPVVIEATQFNGTQKEADRISQEIRSYGGSAWRGPDRSHSVFCIVIKTLEGEMAAEKDDWIIRGVKNEFYPCKPDIFRMTYEAT